MSDTISGTVTSIRKDRAGFQLDGSTWYINKFATLPEDVGTGVTVDVTLSKPGTTFWKKVDVTGGEATYPTASSRPAAGKAFPKGAFPIGVGDGQRSIIRQNALTNARELVLSESTLDDLNLEDKVETIIKVARKFESYAAGDIERLLAEDMMKEDVEH